MSDETALTIFEPDAELKELLIKERKTAIKRFIAGRTPKQNIKEREGPKDKNGNPVMFKYVTGTYIMRQVGLVTGFKWSHKVLGRRTLPDWWKAVRSISESKKEEYTKQEVIETLQRIIRSLPKEIMTDIELTVYDTEGNTLTQTATGAKEVKYRAASPTVPVSIGNSEKASETDAIKKALVYMGFCSDVYGPREELEEMEDWKD